jgi:hypothetical protein
MLVFLGLKDSICIFCRNFQVSLITISVFIMMLVFLLEELGLVDFLCTMWNEHNMAILRIFYLQ